MPLPEPALRSLHERTEGWVAGLKLAALSLAGHPDPERFAAEFSGSERTVAEYLLAEVLEQPPRLGRRVDEQPLQAAMLASPEPGKEPQSSSGPSTSSTSRRPASPPGPRPALAAGGAARPAPRPTSAAGSACR